MSSFQVSDAHLHYLVTAVIDAALSHQNQKVWTKNEANELGQLLADHNAAGMEAHYPGRDYVNAVKYEHSLYRPKHPMTPVEIIKAVHCYTYQCDEANNGTCQVAAYVTELMDNLIKHWIHKLPGYDAAAWGISGEIPRDGAISIMDLI